MTIIGGSCRGRCYRNRDVSLLEKRDDILDGKLSTEVVEDNLDLAIVFKNELGDATITHVCDSVLYSNV